MKKTELDILVEEVKKAVASGNDSYIRGTIEQGIANEFVRELKRKGSCPICGAKYKQFDTCQNI